MRPPLASLHARCCRESRKQYLLDLMVLSNLPEHREAAANVRSKYFFCDERSDLPPSPNAKRSDGVASGLPPLQLDSSQKCLCKWFAGGK